MNQFDNAQFLQHPGIQKMENLLQEYMKLQQHIIKDDYSTLIRTDNQWRQSLNKTIFMPFKLKYLNCAQYTKYNDLILFACLDYDIDRLNAILSNNNLYYIKKTFISGKCLNINIDSFMYMSSNIIRRSHQGFSNYYMYTSRIFADYINMRVILPVYSVLIPFYIFQYKNENLNKEEKRFIINILRNYIKDYKNRINSIELFNDINIEYIKKMEPFTQLIQYFFIYNFTNSPSEYSLHLLLHSIINKIDKSTSTIIINYIMKKNQCKSEILTLIKQYCTLTDEQQNIINSKIILKNL